MREGLSKYDILEYLKTLLGSDNAWRTSAELGKHFDTDSNQVAQLMFPLRADGLVITRNRAGTAGVREVMVSETGRVKERSRKTPRTVEIRSAKDIQVPVVEVVKTEARETTEDAPVTAAPEQRQEVVDAPPALPAQPAVLQVEEAMSRWKKDIREAQAGAVTAAPFEPGDNGGGAVLIDSGPIEDIHGTIAKAIAKVAEADPLATELDALENALTRGKRAPVLVNRKADKQRVLFELANRIEPDAPLTAFLLRELVHDLERAA